ncbi:MAG: hypothetical protein HY865_10635 [Chloroflexi bacterium]|nr:hypothetical protein [Chloroflexota bacterium]
MKNFLLISLSLLLNGLLIVGCSIQTQSTTMLASTLEATKTLTTTATIQPTSTFLPTFTPAQPLIYTPFPTQTLTPVPKDIFDNFQGLSGNCRTANSLDSLMVARYDLNGGVHFTSMANVHIFFDKDEYFPGDSIKLSLSADDTQNYPKFMNEIVVKVIVEDPISTKRNSFYLYDDGTHGDEKVDDGIYVNAFDKTFNTGIYKFYFKLSGRSKGANEKISKECFLAKTVDPISTPTSAFPQGNESISCAKIEASDPIVVRPEGVGGNDSTEYGWEAFYPKAVSLGERIIATWQVGFEGQRPKPNVYMRILDNNLAPAGEVRLLFDRNIVGQTTLIRQENNAVFSYCGRFNTEDRATSAFLDSKGNVISEIVRSPSNIGCGSGPLSVWTGSRLLFYFYSNLIPFDTFPQFDAFLDVADKGGNSISWREISGYGLPAVGHGSVLTSSTSDQGSWLVIHRLDLDGNDLGELTTLEALTYEVDGKIVVGHFRNTYIVSTDNGWMVIASLYAPGVYVAHLGLDGSLISNPVIVEKNLYFVNGLEDVMVYKGGAVILGSSSPFGYSTEIGRVTLFISGDGIAHQWHLPTDEALASGSFFEHQGRLFSIYLGKSTNDNKPTTNQILIRELKCVH